MQTATKDQTAPLFPLAAAVPVSENPHRGYRHPSATLHQAIAFSKPLTPPGLPTCLYDSRVRSRSTGKERDAETGLDYFGARYFASAQGRWTSPDAPFADQHVEDPQSWNMYGYVRNNPLAHVDPNGKACTFANSGSGFCQRADAYANFDDLVHDKTRFFAAASAATQGLADVAVPGLGRAGTSSETRAFLESTGQALLAVNTQAVGQIISGQMSGSGPDLDAKMVHIEQTAVQAGLDNLKGKDARAYGAVIKEINGVLNGKSTVTANALAALGGVFLPTDKAFTKILAGVRKTLGHDIDFANQKDREAAGNALVQHIRQTRRLRRNGHEGTRMQLAKRVVVWLIEVLAEGLLFGCLLGALVSSQIGLLYGVLGAAFAVPVFLFLNGYYLTRVLAGVVWRSRRPWLYPVIAVMLFMIHTHILFVRLKPDMSYFGKATEAPFVAGGACIVFACACGGNWFLHKWAKTDGRRSSPLSTTPQASV